MFELMQRQEPLHEDLVPHLCDLPRLGWRGLKHPLVFQIPYTPEYNAMANEQYRRKKEALAEAEAEGAWGTFVYLHERPYRWPALRDIAKRVPTAKYWPIVGDIWTDSENIFEEAAMVRACLEGYGHDLALRPSMMSEKERLALAGMPATMVIWRGVKTRDMGHGMSWTRARAKAVWFACRFTDAGYLWKAEVRREHVLAYFEGRGEQEIVAFPENVRGARVLRVSRPRGEQ